MFVTLFFIVTIAIILFGLIKSILNANQMGESNSGKVFWFIANIIMYSMMGGIFIGLSFMILSSAEFSYYGNNVDKLQYVKSEDIKIEALSQVKPNKVLALDDTQFIYRGKDNHDMQIVNLNGTITTTTDYEIKDSKDNIIEVYDIKLKDDKPLLNYSLGRKYVIKIDKNEGVSKDFKVLNLVQKSSGRFSSTTYIPSSIEIYD